MGDGFTPQVTALDTLARGRQTAAEWARDLCPVTSCPQLCETWRKVFRRDPIAKARGERSRFARLKGFK
jgi:hypothetical protein